MPETTKAAFYEFADFRVDVQKRLLSRGDEQILLTPKVFETLLTLIEHRDEVIDKERLMSLLWPDSFVEESNLVQNIAVLRKALGENSKQHKFILTVPGRGYRFVAETRLTSSEVSEPPKKITTVKPANGSENGRALPRAFPVSTPLISKKLATLLAIGIIGLIGIGTWFLFTKTWTATPIKSLAVLPLENLSGDPSQEYFVDGMTDALIGDLAKIEGLRVISRTSAMHYKGTGKSLREIADELKVDAVIEGTVQRVGDRVLIRAQLIQAATDQHLWAETYERDLRDVLALQSEIAQAVAREIQIKIVPAEQTRLKNNRPVNRKAFDDYLQGRFLFWNHRTVENLHKAIGFFQSAIEEDPTYAPAYVGLADCYNSLGTEQAGEMPPMNARQLAEEAASKALEIDNELAEAHVALGFVKHFNWDWAAAEREFKLSIELKPNYANAHNYYAGFLASKGLMEEAIAESNRAQELDPFSLAISVQRGFILENARRYDEAIEQLRRVIAMDNENYQAHWFLGPVYASSGHFAEGIEASEKAVAISRTPGALGLLGLCYGRGGRTADARKILNELFELKQSRYVSPAAFVNVYIGLGDKEQAFVWLEKAYHERSYFMTWLKVFPWVDPLRSDPRFQELIRRIGFPQ